MVLRPLSVARRARRTRAAIATSGGLDPALAARSSRPTLRIAHFSDTWMPRRDGVVTVLQTLTAAMAEHGHDHLVVVPSYPAYPDEAEQGDPDHLFRIPSVPCGVAGFRLAGWPRARHVERIAHFLPHAVHVHTPGPVGLLGVLAARRLGLPLVQTYHTDLHAYADAYNIPPRMISAMVRAYAVRLGRHTPELPCTVLRRTGRDLTREDRRHAAIDAATDLLYGEADAVLVPTPAVLTRFQLPVDEDKIYLAPAGVTLPPVPDTARQEFRAAHGIGPDDRVVLFVGRVNREKGIDLLAEAFARVVPQVPRARLLLVGAVYEPKWVEGVLGRAGIADRTVVTGQVTPQGVAQAYASADVFGFASVTDTQGLVVQEAALAGLPPVLADPALQASGPLAGAGVLAGSDPEEFGAALTRLLRDDAYRREVGNRVRTLAERNSPAAFAERMAAIYAQAVHRVTYATRASKEPRRGPFRSRSRHLIA